METVTTTLIVLVTLVGVAVAGFIVYGLIDFVIYCAWYDREMARQKDAQ